jgi:hypothetical protein
VITKQRSDSKILTTKNRQKLSSIKKELLECYKNRQPVLLYGNDRDDCRKELIREVWLAGGGVDQEVEYLDDKNNSTTKEQLENKFKKEWIEKYKTTDSRSSEGNSYHKESNIHINQHTHITDKTWRRIDCGSWNGKQAHNELIRNISDIHYHDRYNENTLRSTGLVMPMGYLFLCKGLVFLDNLHCNSGDAEDSNHYRKIATVIHDRKWGSHTYDDTGIPLQGGGTEQTRFDWLVAYARNPDDFPDYFIEQFKEISLSPEPKAEAIQVHGIIKHRGRKTKNKKHNEFMSVLKDILSDDKNSSLGGYVIKVRSEMERKNLKKKDKNTGELKLIYTDTTIRTYIQRHLLYKTIQERKQKRKKV